MKPVEAVDMLPLLFAASFAIGALHWNLPERWESEPPPADQGIDYIFQPLHRDGQNITVSHGPADPGASLKEETDKVASNEREDARTIERIVPHATCGGKQPGFDVEAKFGSIASQLFHVTISNGQLYTLIYTYGPSAPVNPRVREAINSICPS